MAPWPVPIIHHYSCFCLWQEHLVPFFKIGSPSWINKCGLQLSEDLNLCRQTNRRKTPLLLTLSPLAFNRSFYCYSINLIWTKWEKRFWGKCERCAGVFGPKGGEGLTHSWGRNSSRTPQSSNAWESPANSRSLDESSSMFLSITPGLHSRGLSPWAGAPLSVWSSSLPWTRRFFLVVKMALKNQLNHSLAPVHLLICGLFRGRTVVIKPRAHKQHMRPGFKKIKTHVHKWRSFIWSYQNPTVLPAFVPDKRNHWRDLIKSSSSHGTSFIKLLTSTFTTEKKATKNINTKPQVPKGGVWRRVPVSRQYRQKGFKMLSGMVLYLTI